MEGKWLHRVTVSLTEKFTSVTRYQGWMASGDSGPPFYRSFIKSNATELLQQVITEHRIAKCWLTCSGKASCQFEYLWNLKSSTIKHPRYCNSFTGNMGRRLEPRALYAQPGREIFSRPRRRRVEGTCSESSVRRSCSATLDCGLRNRLHGSSAAKQSRSDRDHRPFTDTIESHATSSTVFSRIL